MERHGDQGAGEKPLPDPDSTEAPQHERHRENDHHGGRERIDDLPPQRELVRSRVEPVVPEVVDVAYEGEPRQALEADGSKLDEIRSERGLPGLPHINPLSYQYVSAPANTPAR